MSLASSRGSTSGIDALTSCACLLSISAAMMSFYLASTPLRIIAVAFGLLVYGSMAIRSSNSSLLLVSLVLFCASLPIAAANAIKTDLKSVFVPLCFLSCLGYAWFALERRRTMLLYEVPFFVYLAWTVQLVLLRGFGPAEFQEYFAGIGRNGYSAILVALTCGYIVSTHVRERSPSPLWVLSALACSFPLYGRSSIAALGLLTIAASMRKAPGPTIAATCLAGLALFFGDVDVSMLGSATNFKSGVDSLRWLFIEEYLDALDSASIFVGVDFAQLPAVQANDGSPDLALLRLHSYLGISVLGYLACFAGSALALALHRRILLLVSLGAILFRSFTDIILLFGTVDMFFLPLLFYPYFARYFPGAAKDPSRASTALTPGRPLHTTSSSAAGR